MHELGGCERPVISMKAAKADATLIGELFIGMLAHESIANPCRDLMMGEHMPRSMIDKHSTTGIVQVRRTPPSGVDHASLDPRGILIYRDSLPWFQVILAYRHLVLFKSVRPGGLWRASMLF